MSEAVECAELSIEKIAEDALAGGTDDDCAWVADDCATTIVDESGKVALEEGAAEVRADVTGASADECRTVRSMLEAEGSALEAESDTDDVAAVPPDDERDSVGVTGDAVRDDTGGMTVESTGTPLDCAGTKVEEDGAGIVLLATT